MECKYYIKNDKTGYLYQDLVAKYQEIRPNDASDIVYSKGEVSIMQLEIKEKLLSLKKEGIIKDNISYRDGEPIISDNESISNQEFIDTILFAEYAKTYQRMDDNDYIKTILPSYKAKGMSDEDALKAANEELDGWKIIGKDGIELHKILSSFDFQNNDRDDFNDFLKGSRFYPVAYQLYDTLKNFKARALGKIRDRAKGEKSVVINNINLKAAIEGLDKDLFGHIDMIVIDGNGTLHLFNYKVTTTAMSPQLVKLEKYRYQMALLKLILASHGFSVQNAKLNIVPIKLQYNDKYTTITSAIVNSDPIEFTERDGRRIFSKYDQVALHFIKSTASINRVTNDVMNEAKTELNLIFTTRDIEPDGIRMTAREWVRKNKDAILDSNNPEYSYIVEFGDGTFAMIKSPESPEKNRELLEAVLNNQHVLHDNSIAIDSFINEVRVGVTKGNFFSSKTYPRTGVWLDTIFSKYFNKNKDTEPKWELLENDLINKSGLILLRNRTTKLLDVISITDLDLLAMAHMKRFDYILGDHLNKSQLAKLGLIKYKSNYGNIEAVKTMVLLNKLIPHITGDFILGKLHIVSLNLSGQGLPFSIEQFNKECFLGVVSYINNLPETKMLNNFNKCQFVDSYGVLVQEWRAITEDITSESEKQELIEVGFNNLITANTLEAKISALYQIEEALLNAYPQLLNTKNLNKYKTSPYLKNPATLYELVLKAIQYYNVGEISSIEEKLNDIDKYAYVSDNVPNRNYLIIVDQYTKAINSIAELTGNKWAPLRQVFEKFYKEVGYTKLLNSIVGGQAIIFRDLYYTNKEGKRSLRLLNPYDIHDMSLIKTHRSAKLQFLKKVLFEFAKIRYPMNGIKFDFTSESDPNLQAFIDLHHDTYFNIPLESASKSTRLLNLTFIQKIGRFGLKALLALKNPKLFAEELLNGEFSEELRKLRDISIEAMLIYNHFSIGESKKTRKAFIFEKGEDFFETNLERLLIHFIEADVQSKEYHKFLILTKAVLLKLELLGKDLNDRTVVDLTILQIEKYVKINVFNTSIMDENSQKILGLVLPLRRLVSDTLIGGNVISGLRDTFEGGWLNTMRAITKYQTNISMKSLSKAYTTVVKNSFTNGRSINIINLLCLIYRLSNVDVSRISEGLTTERGLTNMRNWLYSSLRRPDFLNRMVLFVAQCYEDGVYDAFDIEDGKLVYHWKKDDRFKIFASGNKNAKGYYELMGAYYNAIRNYNLDHPGHHVNYSGDLPMPYSFQEVESFKKVARSIYGSYDKSTRAMLDHMALGTVFGMFSTWMNGIYTNYMAKPMVYNSGQLKLEQAKDEAGNSLFFDEDLNIIVQIKDNEGNIKYYFDGTNEETTNIAHIQPVMDKVPVIVQGIFYTLRDCFKSLQRGFSENNIRGIFKEDILTDPMQTANLRKLFSDLLALAFFASLYGFALTPAYKEFKKGMKERDILTNTGVELLYKASSRSYDGFKGIFNVFQFLGENTNPPIYTLNLKLLKDAISVAAGNKGALEALTGSVAIFKFAQDSSRAYRKKQAEEEAQ